MWLRFHETAWDLYAFVGYTVVVTESLLACGVGDLVGIVLVLFVPGYVSIATLFPGGSDIDWIERIALSFGLSVAIVPGVALFLNFTPLGIRFGSVVSTIALFTLVMCFAASWRRSRLSVEARLSACVEVGLPKWNEYSPLDKGLTIGLATSIVIGMGVLAWVVQIPQPGEPFTDFYILGPGGNATDYPTILNVSQAGHVVIGIENHEGGTTNYSVRVDLVGVRLSYNASSGSNESTDVNRTTLSWMNVSLANSRKWSQQYTFNIPGAGLWKVKFVLYKSGDLSAVYRTLHLYVTVL